MTFKKILQIFCIVVTCIIIVFAVTKTHTKTEILMNKNNGLSFGDTSQNEDIEKIFFPGSGFNRLSIKDMSYGPSYQEIDLKKINKDNLMVILTLGQSHSANFGERKYKCKERVYFFYEEKFYLAKDPILGADGDKGSVWTRLGDDLIENDLSDTVIFINIGVGGSRIDMWRPGTCLHHKILESIDSFENYNLKITHIFWHQGSSDAWYHSSNKALEYKHTFSEIVRSIRDYGVEAPIFICQSTYSYGNSDYFIKKAQKDLVSMDRNIFPGPDSDSIDYSYRYDGVHFSDKGLEILSDLWLEKIIEYYCHYNLFKSKTSIIH